MADSILSITIRDTRDPCGPYRSTSHSFVAQIYDCCGTPLFWKGINYGAFPLNVKGAGGGFIHAQVKVPNGCYLIRAIATCKNVVTDWAWVDVCCNGTVCVDLVLPSVIHCIKRTTIGLTLGTEDKGDEAVERAAPKEVREAIDALRRVVEKIPEVSELPAPPTEEEIKGLAKGVGKKARDKGPKGG